MNYLSNKIKIAIVDDHELFRAGIKLIISNRNDMEIVIEAANGQEFLNKIQNDIPDIVLLDIAMPELDGYEAAKIALQKHPELKIIVLTMHSDKEYYYNMVQIGVKGFILKKSGVNDLLSAIEQVASGNNYFAQDLLKQIFHSLNNPEIDKKLKLSSKEKEVLSLICNGFSTKEISDKLFLGTKSIERYRTNLLQKTQTRNTPNLVMHAIKNKLIQF